MNYFTSDMHFFHERLLGKTTLLRGSLQMWMK